MGDKPKCHACGRGDVPLVRCGVEETWLAVAGFHVDLEADVWVCDECERMERERAERAERRKGRYR